MILEPHSLIISGDENDLDDRKSEEKPSQTKDVQVALDSIVWRKLDRWILPLCTSLFLLSFVDETNIANARLVGLQTSLGVSNYQYTVALTLTYLSYATVELPSTLLLKTPQYVGPDLMLPTMAILWGIVSASQGLVDSYSGLLACRFFLGLCEGGIFPGIVLYLSSFYPRQRLQIRVTTFFALASLSGAFSGLLAAAIDHLDGKGGKPGWAWIFILICYPPTEGILSIIFGMISFFLLPRTPEKARFLTQKERAYVACALKQAGSVSEDDVMDHFSWTEVVRSVKSPQLWLLAVVFFQSGAIVLGLAYFEPSIVASLGYTGNQAQLMSVPPYAAATVLAFISAIVSDRYQCRGCIVIFCSLLQMIGFTMFYVSTSNHVRYGSLFFSVPGTFCAAPALSTWVANNSAPHVRRATSVAVSFTMSELGGVLATWLLGWLSPAPNYTAATVTFIVMSTVMVLFSAANLMYLRRKNRIKAERRQGKRKEDEAEGLGDRTFYNSVTPQFGGRA